MSRQIHRLSAAKVDKTNEPAMLADGGGLYLKVAKGGSKSWIFRFMLDGRSREMGLGALKSTGLKKARQKAGRCRELLDAGIDPIDHAKAVQADRRIKAARTITFDECVDAYIEAHKASWSNAKHAAQWQNTLRKYASPTIGKLAVQDIDIDLVLRCIEPIWATKNETASRVRGRIESVLDWSTVRGYRNGDNPARWRGHLDKVIPAPSKIQKVRHHAALPYKDLPTFMLKLYDAEGIAARALEFTILTAARTGEVIKAVWSEFNLEENIWTIPAERMKSRIEHRRPLSNRAMDIIRAMEAAKCSDWVFPSTRYGKPLSDGAMAAVLRRMGRSDITVHGFRSTFRDWAAEQTNAPNIVAEAAMAHTVGNKVEAAYRRGDLFDKRAKLLENWAAYTQSQPASITPITQRKPKTA